MDETSGTSTTTYEEVMGIQPAPHSLAGGSSSDPISDFGAADALSKRLVDFRKWCVEEANMKLHPAVCIVNGEATDGTKNAPVFEVGPPPGAAQSSATSALQATQAAVVAAQGRLGMVDSAAERALYERTMGCQIWTAKEIKKDEIMMTCPRPAMITPDLVAASDAGRAVLACCVSFEGDNNDPNFWDLFENTRVCESQIMQKVATKPGAQLLVKTLRERGLADKAFKTALAASEKPEPYELAEVGLISTRAPFLAFLIQQRFSPKVNPQIVTETNVDLERAAVSNGGAIRHARRIRTLPGTPPTFGPYARTLPSSVSLPICWKRNELALLSGCIPGLQPLQETVATTTQLANEFTALLKAGILTRFPSIFPPGVITWDRWVWAAAIFTSRVLPCSAYLNDGEENAESFSPVDQGEAIQSPAHIWDELGVLVPFLDMVNHEVEAQCIKWQQNVPQGTDSMKSDESHPPRAVLTRRVKKQQQVYFSYGAEDFSNFKMLVQYGFAQMLNKADVARLGWGLMDAVGKVDPPSDYKPIIAESEGDRPFFVFESKDGQAINDWWSDDRLTLLETEAFPTADNSFMSSLKLGKKMTGTARNDGLYDPILLAASLVSTMPAPELEGLIKQMKLEDSGRSPVTVSRLHQRVLRSYLLFIFTRKLEKLLDNLNSGLIIHYGSLNMWTKASEGGVRYVSKQADTDENVLIGWQSFFDRHAYAGTMEVEKHYYALAPESCVLTLYDSHLQALQLSIDGLVSEEKFETGVLKQLEDLGFVVLRDDDDDPSTINGGPGKLEEGKDDSQRKDDSQLKDDSQRQDGDDKKKEEGKGSAKKRNRNRKRSISNVVSTADRPPAIKLHVGNLSYSTTPSVLFDFFSREYGRDNVLECHIPAERNTGKSRGFGFVTLPEHIARQILNSGRKCEIDGRVLKIAESVSAGTNKPNRHPEAPPPVSNERCGVCSYRPKYCVCPNGPSIPRLMPIGPPSAGRGPGPDYGREYDYYGRDRHRRDHRSRSRSPYRRSSRSERDEYDYPRDYSRDRERRHYDYDRSRSRSHSRDRDRRREGRRDRKDRYFSRERSMERSRDRSRDKSHDRDRSNRRSGSRSRSRSRERRDRRDRVRLSKRRSPSPPDAGQESEDSASIDRRAGSSLSRDGSPGGNDGSDGRIPEPRRRRSRSRSRERSRKKKKRRRRSRSRSPSSSPS